jgi:hypothetical protein
VIATFAHTTHNQSIISKAASIYDPHHHFWEAYVVPFPSPPQKKKKKKTIGGVLLRPSNDSENLGHNVMSLLSDTMVGC